MNGNSRSHENLRAKSGRGLRLIDHHLGLLRGKRLLEHNRSSRGALKQTTNLIPSRTIFCIVILVTDETRVLGFAFGTFISQRLRRVLLQWIGFIFSFSLFLSFRSFICHDGQDGIDFRSFSSIRWGLRSILIWRGIFLLRRGCGRLLGG